MSPFSCCFQVNRAPCNDCKGSGSGRSSAVTYPLGRPSVRHGFMACSKTSQCAYQHQYRKTASGQDNGVTDDGTQMHRLCSPTVMQVDVSHQLQEIWQLVAQQQQEILELRKQVEVLRASTHKIDNYNKFLTKEDYELLPHHIAIVRHAESKGNRNKDTFCHTPDHRVELTETGQAQALEAGAKLKTWLERYYKHEHFKLVFLVSPYTRAYHTFQHMVKAFNPDVLYAREQPQLREQDFGNFQVTTHFLGENMLQDANQIKEDLARRDVFGRFWYRFPNGESGADVYDRMTLYQDHLVRDMMAGRYEGRSLVLVTHGLALRIFLMRWFHWTVDEFLQVYNPPNAGVVILEKLPWRQVQALCEQRQVHTKRIYVLTPESCDLLKGMTPDMTGMFGGFTG